MHHTIIARILVVLGMLAWTIYPHPVDAAHVRNLLFHDRHNQSPSPAGETVIGESTPLIIAGDVGANIDVALQANHGALQRVVILPGATWSFNAAIGDPRSLKLRAINGVVGGGWCNLADRYVEAIQPLTPLVKLHFARHSPPPESDPLAASRRNLVAIWNIDGVPGFDDGRRDLQIENRTADVIRFDVLTIARNPRTIVIRATRTHVAPVIAQRRL